jgi:hypothetical protein
MLRIACLFVSVGMFLGVAGTAKAADKEVKLTGTICCSKCELKMTDKCHTVIKVKEKGKDVIYWFDEAGNKKNHASICQEAKEGTVTGTVKKQGDKMIVTVKKVEFK